MENKLLAAALLDRGAWGKVLALCSQELSDKGKLLLSSIGKYYENDSEATKCDKDIIINSLGRRYPKHAGMFATAINNLPLEEVSVANVVSEIVALKKEKLSLELSQAFANQDLPRIEELLPTWDSLNANDEAAFKNGEEGSEVFYNVSLDNLMKSQGRKLDKIGMAPKALNDYLKGGCTRQEHVVVFGRPEIAKSTFMLSLIYGFAFQGLKTLYVNNEDPYIKFITRFYQCALGWSQERVQKEPAYADRLMAEKGLLDKVVWFSVPDGRISSIEELIRKHSPDVVVVDQMRNINGAAENRVLQLESIARSLRKLAKRHNLLMISVTQAGDSAENKRILAMGDVDWSNTGIQATADLMIGIGADETMKQQGQRIFSFPKNKISARHDPIQLMFDPIQVRVK